MPDVLGLTNVDAGSVGSIGDSVREICMVRLGMSTELTKALAVDPADNLHSQQFILIGIINSILNSYLNSETDIHTPSKLF